MTANTSTKKQRDEVLARVAGLFVDAYAFIRGQIRSNDQVELLLRALQLFKEDKLTLTALGVPRDAIPSFTARRNAFMLHVREVGPQLAYREFLEELSAQSRNHFVVHFRANTFPAMLLKVLTTDSLVNYTSYRRYRGWGAKATDSLNRALDKRGLNFGMLPEEVCTVFRLTIEELGQNLEESEHLANRSAQRLSRGEW